jgi:hypothetical protein
MTGCAPAPLYKKTAPDSETEALLTLPASVYIEGKKADFSLFLTQSFGKISGTVLERILLSILHF